jgi:hypothetical protein
MQSIAQSIVVVKSDDALSRVLADLRIRDGSSICISRLEVRG